MDESSKKKILIDVTILFDQYSKRGIGKYAKGLLKRLIRTVVEDKNWELNFIGFFDLKKNLIEIGLTQFAIDELMPNIHFHTLGETQLSGIKNFFLWRNKYLPIIRDIEPDIFFSLNFERGLPNSNVLNDKIIKTATVIHDVIPDSPSLAQFLPKFRFLRTAFIKLMWRRAKKVDLLLAQSNFIKNELLKNSDIKASIVQQIYSGVDETYLKENMNFPKEREKEVLDRVGISDTYYFYDSGLEPYKGSNQLLDLFSILLKKKAKLPKQLVLTGGGDLTAGVGKAIKGLNDDGIAFLQKAKQLSVLDNVLSTGRIDDEDLKIILKNSFAYLFLSEFEGFGNGLVQAMAAGIPVVTNNLASNPELSQNGALILEEQDIKKMAKEIAEYLSDEKRKETRVNEAQNIVKQYNWDDAVDKTWNSIKSLVPEEVNEYNEVEAQSIGF